MIALLSKLMEKNADQLILGGAVVIAANAGGVWTPIGDVTTTMLWIGGNIGSVATMRDLIAASLIALIVPLTFLSFMTKERLNPSQLQLDRENLEPMGKQVFFLGRGALVSALTFYMRRE